MLICSAAGAKGAIRQNLHGAKHFRVAVADAASYHVRVQIHLHHLDDFHLAERCLDGDSLAIAELRQRLKTGIQPFLMRSGARTDEAAEICGVLLTDLVMPDGSRTPRLQHYKGMSSLDTWLHRVALNAFIIRKRREARERSAMPSRIPLCDPASGDEPGAVVETAKDPKDDRALEAPLLELMLRAVEEAFQSCEPENFVLLQLSHCDRIQGKELAVMFRCHPAQITRRLEAAQQGICESVKAYVRREDPYLELQWEDFLEFCRTTTPACFGLD